VPRPLAPTLDENGQPLPDWKRKVLQKRLDDEWEKEKQLVAEAEQREAQWIGVPAWRRAMLEKKDKEAHASPVAPVVDVPVPPPPPLAVVPPPKTNFNGAGLPLARQPAALVPPPPPPPTILPPALSQRSPAFAPANSAPMASSHPMLAQAASASALPIPGLRGASQPPPPPSAASTAPSTAHAMLQQSAAARAVPVPGRVVGCDALYPMSSVTCPCTAF
jgi:hypothetical protein